jgi:hypothetical protein
MAASRVSCAATCANRCGVGAAEIGTVWRALAIRLVSCGMQRNIALEAGSLAR